MREQMEQVVRQGMAAGLRQGRSWRRSGGMAGLLRRQGVCAGLALLLLPAAGAQQPSTVAITVDVSQGAATGDGAHAGTKISRYLFGQFAENLGHGLYGGIWVGPDSPIPNTRGIRKDVVEALRAIHVPDVRWPGGCFADQYHWRKGIGPAAQRPATLNVAWGNVVDTNAFGTDEFLDFMQQIGSAPYVSVNVGSGTVEEAADWVEYMTAAAPTALAKERAANGHAAPYRVGFLGLGNESWSCGGDMSPEFYVSQMKRYSRFVNNMNPAQQHDDQMWKIAVGPGTADTKWTEAVMQAWKQHDWSWDIQGMSLHWYTVPNGWPPSTPSTGFGLKDYVRTIQSGMGMDGLLRKQEAVMDKYDPEKKVALVVDEWGAWHAPLKGTNPAFLMQQNSMRDAILAAMQLNIFARHADRVRMTNIAQMINVLQAMILTDGPKMVLTPTYYVYQLYVPFQDATFVPVRLDGGSFTEDSVTLPRVDALAARDGKGRLWLEMTNVDPKQAVTIDAGLSAGDLKADAEVDGQTLTAAAVDSINSFDNPHAVMPKPVHGSLHAGHLQMTLPPLSVTVMRLQ